MRFAWTACSDTGVSAPEAWWVPRFTLHLAILSVRKRLNLSTCRRSAQVQLLLLLRSAGVHRDPPSGTSPPTRTASKRQHSQLAPQLRHHRRQQPHAHGAEWDRLRGPAELCVSGSNSLTSPLSYSCFYVSLWLLSEPKKCWFISGGFVNPFNFFWHSDILASALISSHDFYETVKLQKTRVPLRWGCCCCAMPGLPACQRWGWWSGGGELGNFTCLGL